jgi:uncharacterized membrane protein (DUF2068 family)
MSDAGRSSTKAPRQHNALALIAIFKLVKVVILLLVAAEMSHLLQPGQLDLFAEDLRGLPVAAGWRPMLHLIDWITQLSPRKIEVAAIVACAYATLYAIEGVGLLLQKRWAEYLTTIATASLIPFELYELAQRLTVLRAAAVIINVAIVVYLIHVLRADKTRR